MRGDSLHYSRIGAVLSLLSASFVSPGGAAVAAVDAPRASSAPVARPLLGTIETDAHAASNISILKYSTGCGIFELLGAPAFGSNDERNYPITMLKLCLDACWGWFGSLFHEEKNQVSNPELKNLMELSIIDNVYFISSLNRLCNLATQMAPKSTLTLSCVIVALTATVCFAEETEAQLRAQNERLRKQMATLKTRNTALEKGNAVLTTAQKELKESKAKLAAIKATLPVKQLAGIVSATVTGQCAGVTATAVLQGRHDACAAAKFSSQTLGETGYGGSSYGGPGYGATGSSATSNMAAHADSDSGALAR